MTSTPDISLDHTKVLKHPRLHWPNRPGNPPHCIARKLVVPDDGFAPAHVLAVKQHIFKTPG